MSAVASPDCFQGQWQVSVRKSDNPERFLNKLARKQKQQQRAIYRSSGSDELEIDLSLIDTLPRFIFLLQDLDINIQTDQVILKQPDLVRNVSTGVIRQAVSLKALQQNNETQVAGWDEDRLVIETTALDGSRVTETFFLEDGAMTLHVEVVIKKEMEKEIIMEKIYQRNEIPASCQLLGK